MAQSTAPKLVLGEPRPARVLAEARHDPGSLLPRS